MQNMFITHLSAFSFYRQRSIHEKIELPISNIQLNCKQSIKLKDILLAQLPYIGENNKIDIITANQNARHSSSKVNIHYCSHLFPYGSFLKYKPGIYIASPELVFCQLANSLTKEELLLAGMELCGTYSMSAEFATGFANKISAITTPSKIQNFAKQLVQSQPHTKGVRLAMELSRYLGANSASPQESRLYLKLCLPRKFGGYGLHNIKLNKTIKLSKSSYNILGYNTIKPDLCNEKTKVAIEYDSAAFHDNAGQNTKDKLRWDALHNDGWKLYNFVPEQMKDIYKFDAIAKSILKANKQDARILTSNFEERKRNLWINLR